MIFTTAFEAYKNSSTNFATLNIGADVIANLSAKVYTVNIPYSIGTAVRADIYLDGNTVKIPANASTRLVTGGPYQFKSTEAVSIFLDYTSGSIDATIEVFNGTGSSITLIPQNIIVSVVEYVAPLIAI